MSTDTTGRMICTGCGSQQWPHKHNGGLMPTPWLAAEETQWRSWFYQAFASAQQAITPEGSPIYVDDL